MFEYPVPVRVQGRRFRTIEITRLATPFRPAGKDRLTRLEGSLALTVNRRIRNTQRFLRRRSEIAEQLAAASKPAEPARDVHGRAPSAARSRIEELGEQAPSLELLGELLREDVELLPADAGVAWLAQVQRCKAWIESIETNGLVAVAGKVQRIHEYRVGVPTNGSVDSVRTVKVHDSVCAEIAATTHQTRASTARKVEAARDLAGAMRPLRDALHEGRLSTNHVLAVREELVRLPIADGDLDLHEQRCATVLTDVISYAATHTPAQARKRTRALVAQIEPINSEERNKRAARSHGVWVTDEGDDTSLLCSRMPTADAHHALAAIKTLARNDRLPGAGELSVGQREVVALMSLVHHGTCGAADPSEIAAVAQARATAHVEVVVSADALAGLSDRPGYLAGEVASADAIRALVKSCGEDSTMRRLITDPQSGRLLDYGRRTYAIPDALREFLAARDRTCRHPGCGIPARRCQIDHAKPYSEGGETSAQNTGPLCTYHHNGKTHEDWDIIESRADGSCTWRSPHGRIYHHEPPPVLPPSVLPPPANPPPDEGDLPF